MPAPAVKAMPQSRSGMARRTFCAVRAAKRHIYASHSANRCAGHRLAGRGIQRCAAGSADGRADKGPHRVVQHDIHLQRRGRRILERLDDSHGGSGEVQLDAPRGLNHCSAAVRNRLCVAKRLPEIIVKRWSTPPPFTTPSKTYSWPSGVICTPCGENCWPLTIGAAACININWPLVTCRFACWSIIHIVPCTVGLRLPLGIDQRAGFRPWRDRIQERRKELPLK